MVIPVFNESNVLPPFSGGSPALPTDLSPYTANMCEVIARFGGTPERKAILVGLLNFRQALRARGLTEGFQWIDGSFVENVEVSRGRPPADIDLVTFVRRPEDLKNDSQWASFVKATPELFNPRETKRRYLCDAYLVLISNDVQPTESPAEAAAHRWRQPRAVACEARADRIGG